MVTPMEVIKIRLQAQHHSMADPLDIPKYRNAAHALYTVVKEEGVGALYRGISLTALRQGKNATGGLSTYSTKLMPIPRFESSRQFHRIHRVQKPAAPMATAISRQPNTLLSNHPHRAHLRCDGSALKCAH